MTTSKTKNYADFMKSFSDFTVPAMDFNSFFALQRRNIEAFSAANQVVSEGVQAISRRQAEIMQAQIEDMLKTAREVLSSGSPEASATKQADYAKALLEQSMVYAREIAEMASKSNVEALDIINKRVVDSLEDFNGLVKKAA